MEKIVLIALMVSFIAGACTDASSRDNTYMISHPESDKAAVLEKATFAGGCFWCMEPPFEKLEGVAEVISGYTGGNKKKPTYKKGSSGTPSHYEAIQVIYKPK